ncbi:MAG: hypothetical protein R3F65_23020 [bacterium]
MVRCLPLALLLTALAAGPAAADEHPLFYLGASAGGHIVLTDIDFGELDIISRPVAIDSSLYAELRLGLDLSPDWSVELAFGYLPFGSTTETNDGLDLAARARWTFADVALRPYLLAGGGVYINPQPDPIGTPTLVAPEGHYGIGLGPHLLDNLRLRVEVRHQLTDGLVDEPGMALVALAGLDFLPGAGDDAPAPPADRDGDGVPDARDACPDVPAPTPDGCPVPEPPADRDGDGVPDARDACPDEPAPTPDGCPVPEPPADRDGDSVPDDRDACPDEPAPTPDGCPARAGAHGPAHLRADRSRRDRALHHRQLPADPRSRAPHRRGRPHPHRAPRAAPRAHHRLHRRRRRRRRQRPPLAPARLERARCAHRARRRQGPPHGRRPRRARAPRLQHHPRRPPAEPTGPVHHHRRRRPRRLPRQLRTKTMRRLTALCLCAAALAGCHFDDEIEGHPDGATPDAAPPDAGPDAAPGCVDGTTRSCTTEGGCPGEATCRAGAFGPCAPPAETCDGADDDCDGNIDEGFAVGEPCAVGVGACAADAITVCNTARDGVRCPATPGQPGREACDGIDDDCDGTADEAIEAMPCETDRPGVCAAGTTACVDGATTCSPAADPTDERCDGLDNDCDDRTDEAEGGAPLTERCYTGPESTDGIGRCLAGVATCVGGAFADCEGELLPVAETCNDTDDDCDGTPDDIDFGECICRPGAEAPCYTGPPGTQGVGPCRGGTWTCADDGTAYGPCIGEVLPAPESCAVPDADLDCDADEDDCCESDLECPADQYCDGTCVDDACVPGVVGCDGDAFGQCIENGSRYAEDFVCGSPIEGFDTCAIVAGEGVCACRDDWDCPRHLVCQGGACVGTGEPPTCLFEPRPFSDARPAPEIVWGSEGRAAIAVGRPFSRWTQAAMTPVVANLDDDNGDGRIDARDFPEIVFTTYCGGTFRTNGALRAIHGGGPDKGRDAFAVLGDQRWRAGDPLPDPDDCAMGDINPTAAIAVADLDDPATSDGRPEIIVIHESGRGGIIVYDNTGAELSRGHVDEMPVAGDSPAITIANLDGRGMAEAVVGPYVITFERAADGALEVVDRFEGRLGRGINNLGGMACVADLLGDARPEIVAGSTVYGFPRPPAGATRRADCQENGGPVVPVDADQRAWCAGRLLVRWDAQAVAPGDMGILREGFCAIADVLGADLDAPTGPENPLDGAPEVILIGSGRLQIFDGRTGALRTPAWIDARMESPEGGGAPNVDDFDADGFPEIGTSFARSYVVFDLQPPTDACSDWPDLLVDGGPAPAGNPPRLPGGACAADADCAAGARCGAGGRCACLHNGWRHEIEDDNSQVTGSTVFDLNGDGAAEVIYNGECWFRIYDGRTGDVLLKEPSESRTRMENPVVADVDNDGNAEIVLTVGNESDFCSERATPLPGPQGGRLLDLYNAGLEVWGDPEDVFIPARRIWHQHTYHMTEVTEAGAVPLTERTGWADLDGRGYNAYRSQPRGDAVAPDLIVRSVQYRSPDVACGDLSDQLEISATIASVGDLRVGPGVLVAFRSVWGAGPTPLIGPDGDAIVVELQESLEPGATTEVHARYDVTRNGANPDRLPNRVRVIVDANGAPAFGRARECREDNNTTSVVIDESAPRPDLRIDRVTAQPRNCPRADLTATVTNDGAAAAGVRVRFYAGLPALGYVLGEVGVGAMAAGETRDVMLAADTLPSGRPVVVHAVVDPDRAIDECSHGDNAGQVEVACRVP